jgi:hypothetical protein
MIRRFAPFALLLAISAFGQEHPAPMAPHDMDSPAMASLAADIQKQGVGASSQELAKLAKPRRDAVLKMLEGDELGTATDFIRASVAYDDPQGFYETRCVQHIFAMMALSLGAPDAASNLERTWDSLMISMGQRQRFGYIKIPPPYPQLDKFKPDPIPAALRTVFDDPVAARAAAAKANDNAEIKQMVDADQKIREGTIDWKKLMDAHQQDLDRESRALQLIAKGVPKTANDFGSLGLVMQHSDDFLGYRTACELMMAAVLLGHSSTSLLAATFDRMLVSLGHRQKLGTQFWAIGLAPLDPTGTNDRIRMQFGQMRMADLKAQEADIVKRYFGG